MINDLPDEISGDLILPMQHNAQSITYTIDETLIEGVLKYPFITKDESVTLNATLGSDTISKTITIKASPIIHDLHITTLNQAPIDSRDVYVTGAVSVDSETFGKTGLTMQIKGRGNSSWEYPKKPYRIKFDERQSILGMREARDYVLLAEYNDKSLIRNYLAHYFSTFLNIGYHLETRFVSLYINGSYRGVYLLTEQIEQDKNRLDIDDSLLADGGFLIELETEERMYKEGIENIDWFTVDNRYFVIKSPSMDELSPMVIETKINFMKGYLNNFLASIETDTYDTYIDTDNFIDYFILSELFKQVDVGYSSVFTYKDLNEKMHMGPVWDFDISSGNGDYYDSSYSGYWVDYNPWFYRLIQQDSFEQKFITRFKALMDEYFDDLIAELEYVSGLLYQPAIQNFEKWDILDIYVWPNPPAMVEANTYSKQITYLKKYLNK